MTARETTLPALEIEAAPPVMLSSIAPGGGPTLNPARITAQSTRLDALYGIPGAGLAELKA